MDIPEGLCLRSPLTSVTEKTYGVPNCSFFYEASKSVLIGGTRGIIMDAIMIDVTLSSHPRRARPENHDPLK
jgi:hypothetical protein